MKRYGLFYQNGHDGEMEEDPDGDYVLYEDAAALQRQLEDMTAERDLARTELSIADTHRKDLSRTLDVANATIDRLRK